MESWEELLHVCAGTEEIIQQMKDHRILDEAGRSIVSSLLAGCGDAVKLLIQISTLVYILFGMLSCQGHSIFYCQNGAEQITVCSRATRRTLQRNRKRLIIPHHRRSWGGG